eukprot:UN34237
MLKPGGRMVYSTCSIDPIENEAVVHQLLQYTDLKLVDISKDLSSKLKYHKGMRKWKVLEKNGKYYDSYGKAKADIEAEKKSKKRSYLKR